MMKKMDKKKVWLLGILISVLITATLWVTILATGGSGGTGTDASRIPFLSFFAIFILPGVIQQQKKRREQMINKNQLVE